VKVLSVVGPRSVVIDPDVSPRYILYPSMLVLEGGGLHSRVMSIPEAVAVTLKGGPGGSAATANRRTIGDIATNSKDSDTSRVEDFIHSASMLS